MKARYTFFVFLFLSIWLSEQVGAKDVDVLATKKQITELTNKAKSWVSKNIDSSLVYAQQAVELAYSIDDKQSIQANLLIIGGGFSQLKEFKRAMEVLERVKSMMETNPSKDASIQIQWANEMGILQRSLMNYDKALNYHQQAQQLAVDKIPALAQTLVNIGKVYREQNKDSLALGIFQESLRIQEEHNGDQVLFSSLIELGLVYEQLGDYDKAFSYFNKALMQEEERGNTKAVTTILNTQAASYAKQMQAHASIGESERALQLAEANNDYGAAAEACRNLATCYKALKRFEQSLKFENLADVYKNQLLDIEKKRLVTVMQANFDLVQKEMENQVLREKEQLLKRDIRRQMATIGFICLALFLALALAFMLYTFNQSRKKTNSLLQEQNEAIQAQKVEIEKAMDQLKSAQSQLVQSEKMASLGQLTAGIAHEINNPVNFIYSGIAGLKKNLSALMTIIDQYDTIEDKTSFSDKIQEIQQLKSAMDYQEVRTDIDGLLLSIEDGAERTGEIVKSLRTFSRTDATELNEINVHHNIDSTLVLLQNRIRDHITIEKIYDPNLPNIESYNGQLNQVIMNLLTNAVQAIGEEGHITIATRSLTNQIEIEITDSGTGIPEAEQSRIFEPFFTTKEVGEGTGLGLSISYGIIQKHNGSIAVASEVDKGTSFTIRLPIKQG